MLAPQVSALGFELVWLLLSMAVLCDAGAATTTSQYAGQESREIKSLSPSEVGDLLAGRGMGLAKAAELNGYPSHGNAGIIHFAGQSMARQACGFRYPLNGLSSGTSKDLKSATFRVTTVKP